MKEKLRTLLAALNEGLVEREFTLKSALLTVLAGENLVLIGPPGTGKSMVARRIADCLAANSSDTETYFEYLLTKFSTPEEIFGPLSISALKADCFKRNTAGYLPTVRLAFLDEIFKASSSILNALLTILNERMYHNGAVRQEVPLQALIAASNELPTDQEELGALYDRFLVRVFVDYVQEENLARLFEPTAAFHLMPENQLTAAELQAIRTAAEAVTIPVQIVQAIQRIWAAHKETFKEDRRESLSDRRLKKIIHLLRVSAATNARTEVDLSDVLLLKDCLWNHQDNRSKVQELVMRTLREFNGRKKRLEWSRFFERIWSTQALVQTYEPAADGQTLVPVTMESMPVTVDQHGSGTPTLYDQPRKAVVKGFKGSGTAEDPLLIATLDDLMDLSRSDVGGQGYYFRQTADIDISGVSTWHELEFQGHYDGYGFEICDKGRIVFKTIVNGAVRNLNLKNCSLAVKIIDSLIEGCLSTNDLVTENVKNCTVTACEAGINLIKNSSSDSTLSYCMAAHSIVGDSANNCTIRNCQSGFPVIWRNAEACKVYDCLAQIDITRNSGQIYVGGVVTTSIDSTIERSIISGKWNGYAFFSGIVDSCKNSKVNNCALGVFAVVGSNAVWHGRIAREVINSELENNISIDTNIPHPSYAKGKSIAAAQFNQRYFEYTLGWDFDTVWRWDDQKNQPILRAVGVGSAKLHRDGASEASADTSTVDLLTQQIHANLWL